MRINSVSRQRRNWACAYLGIDDVYLDMKSESDEKMYKKLANILYDIDDFDHVNITRKAPLKITSDDLCPKCGLFPGSIIDYTISNDKPVYIIKKLFICPVCGHEKRTIKLIPQDTVNYIRGGTCILPKKE